MLTVALALATLPAVMYSDAAARNPSHWSGQRGEWMTKMSDAYPTPSPDGKRIVFQSDRSGGKSELWVAEADGSNPRLFLKDDYDLQTPVFSPDGTKIVYAASINDESEVFIVDADGRNKRRITNWPGSDGHPHWSGDGTRIFFNSDRDAADIKLPWAQRTHDLYSVRLDGSDLRKHSDCKSICSFPSPSPDGRWLAYRRFDPKPGFRWTQEPSPRDSEVYIANIDGSAPRNLTNSQFYEGYPMWSPDSRWVTFASTRGGEVNIAHIYVVRPDGSGLKQVTQGWWSHTTPVFTPDGASIYTSKNFDAIDWGFGLIAKVAVPTG